MSTILTPSLFNSLTRTKSKWKRPCRRSGGLRRRGAPNHKPREEPDMSEWSTRVNQNTEIYGTYKNYP